MYSQFTSVPFVLTSRQLFFLLSESPTQFNEDNDRFRDFFDQRYTKLMKLKNTKDCCGVYSRTMGWLDSEVFSQEDDAEIGRVDAEQRQCDEEFDRDFDEFCEERRRRWAEGVEICRGLGNSKTSE